MRRRRSPVLLRAAGASLAAFSLVLTAVPAVTASASPAPGAPPLGAAPPDGWEGPQVVDATRGTSVSGLLATRAGTYASWSRPRVRARWVSHRDPGPTGDWSAPVALPGWRSGLQGGPQLGLGRGGAVTFWSRQVGDRTFYWELSADGRTSPQRSFPFRSFMPTTADSAGRRWLVAGTSQGTPGRPRVAVRGPQGRWRVSDPFPNMWNGSVVGAWFDRAGRPHLLVVRAVADTRPAPAARGYPQRPIMEAVLARDGSWSQTQTVALTPGGDAGAGERPRMVANADGDVTLSYPVVTEEDSLSTELVTRPAGGSWSDPIGFPERNPDLAIDAAGRTVVVRPGEEVRLGRVHPDGTLDGWQELTGPTFDVAYYGPFPLAVSPAGVAVLTMNGTRADPGGGTATFRTLRCGPDDPCEPVGDFDGAPAYPLLDVGPDGAAYLLAEQESICGARELCSWRLPAPAPDGGGPRN